MILTIKNLAYDKKYFDEVLNLIYKEWGSNNYEFWRSWVKNSMLENEIPMTFIVFCDDVFVGTFSLWRCDLQSRQDLFPWLGGIVVKEEWRRKGIGTFIQNQAKKILEDLGFVKAYLFTKMVGYYEKNDWQFIEMGIDEKENLVRIYEICLIKNKKS
ncbi:N-acetyltransferase [Bacteroidia bacterium]|nr:N-acetyltransferase [Bacteroidia bacterium]